MFASLSSKMSLLCEPPTCVVTVIGQIITIKSKLCEWKKVYNLAKRISLNVHLTFVSIVFL